MQADRRALNITLNSIGTELTRDDRRKLYSNFGLLYPHGQVPSSRPTLHSMSASP
jgi:vacuolar-type H+-ATPase subunit C/Vma6